MVVERRISDTQTFNSLCEIQQRRGPQKREQLCGLSILYVRFTNIPKGLAKWLKTTFNSLCEIPELATYSVPKPTAGFQFSM